MYSCILGIERAPGLREGRVMAPLQPRDYFLQLGHFYHEVGT